MTSRFTWTDDQIQFDDNESGVEKAGNGVMLAFWPDEETQKQIAAEDGESVEDIHLTLAYFGKQDELPMENLPILESVLETFAASQPPIAGVLSGLGRFPATPQSDGKDVVYLGAHFPDIQEFRQRLVDAVEMSGLTPKSNFGFNPHITLKFVTPHAPHLLQNPDPIPVTFDKFVLSIGPEKKVFNLTGEPADYNDVHQFEIEGSIAKKDEAQHLVFGWFSIISIDGKAITDTQGDVITAETLEAAAYDYVLHARIGGEMHSSEDGSPKQIGRMIESVVFTQEKQKAMLESLHAQKISAQLDLGCVGWWGGFYVEDKDVWEKVTSEKLRAFSIGGRGKRAVI